MDKKELVKLKCDKCGYSWYSRSRMVFVCCPSCRQAVRTKQIKKV